MKINYDFYKHKENIPIREVVDLLGLKMDKDGHCLCPCHSDTNPSMFITESGKYENRWHCFVDGEGGDPLNLVLAVKYGISPSVYFANPANYKKEREESAKFLDKYFPGAIEIEPEYQKQNELPTLSYKFLKEIGLTTNPLLMTYVKPFSQNNFSKEDYKQIDNSTLNNVEQFEALNKLEAIELIRDKIDEYLSTLFTKTNQFFKDNYPDMPIEGRNYINKVTSDKFDYANNILKQLDSYLEKHNPSYHQVITDESLNEIEEYEQSCK